MRILDGQQERAPARLEVSSFYEDTVLLERDNGGVFAAPLNCTAKGAYGIIRRSALRLPFPDRGRISRVTESCHELVVGLQILPQTDVYATGVLLRISREITNIAALGV